MACAAASWAPRLSGPIDLRWDAGVYYVLGTSLAEGRGYRLLYEPGEIEATQYPPLLPAIIAGHERMLGTRDPIVVGTWLRRSWFLLFEVYVVSCYFLARTFLGPLYAASVALVSAFNPYIVFYSNQCTPELPFAVTSALAILSSRLMPRRSTSALTFLLSTLSYLLRTVGVALLAAWVAERVVDGRMREAAVRLALATLPLVAWQGYVAGVEHRPEYSQPAYEYQRAAYLFHNVSYAANIFSFKDPFAPELGPATPRNIVDRAVRNAERMPFTFVELFARKTIGLDASKSSIPRPLAWALFLIPGGLVAAGTAVQLARREWFPILYVGLYFAAVALTPWPNQLTKYLAPLVPLLTIALIEAPLAARDRWKRAASALAAAMIVGLLVEEQLLLRNLHDTDFARVASPGGGTTPLFHYSAGFAAWDRAMEWLEEHSERGAIIAAAMPESVYLKTGRRAVMPPFEVEPAEAQRLMDTVPVRYLVVDSFGAGVTMVQKYGAPLPRAFPRDWMPVYRAPNDRLVIYRRESPG